MAHYNIISGQINSSKDYKMKNNSLIYPVVPAERWAKLYSLSVRPNPCESCGRILFPTKPFATGDWRGLMSEPHSCGNEFDLFIATKATAAGRRDYIDYFRVLKNQLIFDPQ